MSCNADELVVDVVNEFWNEENIVYKISITNDSLSSIYLLNTKKPFIDVKDDIININYIIIDDSNFLLESPMMYEVVELKQNQQIAIELNFSKNDFIYSSRLRRIPFDELLAINSKKANVCIGYIPDEFPLLRNQSEVSSGLVLGVEKDGLIFPYIYSEHKNSTEHKLKTVFELQKNVCK